MFDLDSLSGTGEYKTARVEIVQHRQSNPDFPDEWPLAYEPFRLGSSDDALLRFLAEIVHPEVIESIDEQRVLVRELNAILRADRVELVEAGSISGMPRY